MNKGERSNISKLQQVDLNIAKEFANICDRHGLLYFMLGGTMLGAVRHKGFIPWDDDMDFGMPRDDYESFLEIASKELPKYMKVINLDNTPNYHYYFSRVIDSRIKVIEERIENESNITNASIDIFPIDGSPNIKVFREIYYFRVLFHRALMSLCFKDSIDRKRKRSIAEKALLFIMEKIPVEKLTTPYKQKCEIDKLLRNQIVKDSKYIGNIMGAYRTKEMVPAEYYGNGEFYQFEDTKLRGLKMYDEYLTYTYGDYMQLPPEEERKMHYKVVEIYGEHII